MFNLNSAGEQRCCWADRAAVGVLCAATLVSAPAFAQEAAGSPQTTNTVGALQTAPGSVASQPVLPAAPQAEVSTTEGLHALDTTLGYKGWDIPYPSFDDTLTRNWSGYRTTLAKYGIGFIGNNLNVFSDNLLDTPSKYPNQYGFYGKVAPCVSKLSPCAGNQAYTGQQVTFTEIFTPTLIFDTSRYGVPDGEIKVSAQFVRGTYEGFLPNYAALSETTWYQTAFNKRLEIELGYQNDAFRYMGAQLGGNFASTFGPGGQINVLLGESDFAMPEANFTLHLGDGFYDKFGFGTAMPVRGTTGNPYFDAFSVNRLAVKWAARGEGFLVIDEAGYRVAAKPGSPTTWIRIGGMHNFSEFTDFSRLSSDPDATVRGNEMGYILADRQLWQQDPSSSRTAFRGIYAGVTFMYAPPRETLVKDYYEGRLYWIGPFARRPSDILSFVYFHQDYSKYAQGGVNALSAQSNLLPFGYQAPGLFSNANSGTLSYLAHLASGVYLQGGFAFTDNPAIYSYQDEGSAFEAQLSLTTVF